MYGKLLKLKFVIASAKKTIKTDSYVPAQVWNKRCEGFLGHQKTFDSVTYLIEVNFWIFLNQLVKLDQV